MLFIVFYQKESLNFLLVCRILGRFMKLFILFRSMSSLTE